MVHGSIIIFAISIIPFFVHAQAVDTPPTVITTTTNTGVGKSYNIAIGDAEGVGEPEYELSSDTSIDCSTLTGYTEFVGLDGDATSTTRTTTGNVFPAYLDTPSYALCVKVEDNGGNTAQYVREVVTPAIGTLTGDASVSVLTRELYSKVGGTNTLITSTAPTPKTITLGSSGATVLTKFTFDKAIRFVAGTEPIVELNSALSSDDAEFTVEEGSGEPTATNTCRVDSSTYATMWCLSTFDSTKAGAYTVDITGVRGQARPLYATPGGDYLPLIGSGTGAVTSIDFVLADPTPPADTTPPTVTGTTFYADKDRTIRLSELNRGQTIYMLVEFSEPVSIFLAPSFGTPNIRVTYTAPTTRPIGVSYGVIDPASGFPLTDGGCELTGTINRVGTLTASTLICRTTVPTNTPLVTAAMLSVAGSTVRDAAGNPLSGTTFVGTSIPVVAPATTGVSVCSDKLPSIDLTADTGTGDEATDKITTNAEVTVTTPSTTECHMWQYQTIKDDPSTDVIDGWGSVWQDGTGSTIPASQFDEGNGYNVRVRASTDGTNWSLPIEPLSFVYDDGDEPVVRVERALFENPTFSFEEAVDGGSFVVKRNEVEIEYEGTLPLNAQTFFQDQTILMGAADRAAASITPAAGACYARVSAVDFSRADENKLTLNVALYGGVSFTATAVAKPAVNVDGEDFPYLAGDLRYPFVTDGDYNCSINLPDLGGDFVSLSLSEISISNESSPGEFDAREASRRDIIDDNEDEIHFEGTARALLVREGAKVEILYEGDVLGSDVFSAADAGTGNVGWSVEVDSDEFEEGENTEVTARYVGVNGTAYGETTYEFEIDGGSSGGGGGGGGGSSSVYAPTVGGQRPENIQATTTATTTGVTPTTPKRGVSVTTALQSPTLKTGARGESVRGLQQFLNDESYTVAQSGAGSKGQETTYFGSLTTQALTKYQTDKGLEPTGEFDEPTRLYIAVVQLVRSLTEEQIESLLKLIE